MEALEYFVRPCLVDSCASSVVCEIQGFLILKQLGLSPVAVIFCLCSVAAVNMPKLALLLTQRGALLL